eukprot:363422-Chlamydomonas_euryale.AAC.4
MPRACARVFMWCGPPYTPWTHPNSRGGLRVRDGWCSHLHATEMDVRGLEAQQLLGHPHHSTHTPDAAGGRRVWDGGSWPGGSAAAGGAQQPKLPEQKVSGRGEPLPESAHMPLATFTRAPPRPHTHAAMHMPATALCHAQ